MSQQGRRRVVVGGVAAALAMLAGCQWILGVEETVVVGDGGLAGACALREPCPDPDPAHCAASCEEDGDDAVCRLAAADRDGDGHGDVGCAAVAGGQDDCDDAHDTVYPGAEEKCDGLDNDCDGLRDLQEGLTLAGELKTFATPAENVRVAWAATTGSYGIAWKRDGWTRFNLLDEGGRKVLADDLVVAEGTVIGMAAGPDVFGLLVVGATQETSFYAVSGAGRLLGGVIVAQDEPFSVGVAYLSNATWAVMHDTTLQIEGDPRRRFGQIVSRDGRGVVGEATTELPHDGSLEAPRLAAFGNELMVVWKTDFLDTPDEVYAQRYAANLTAISEPIKLPGDLARPDGMHWGSPAITATARGYAVAWGDGKDGGEVHDGYFVELGPDGQALCGPRPQQVSGENRTLNVQSLSELPGGDVLIGWQTFFVRSGAMHLTIMRAGCQGDEYASFPNGGYAPTQLGLAVGKKSVLAAWNTFVTMTTAEVETRVMGIHLCDPAPDAP